MPLIPHYPKESEAILLGLNLPQLLSMCPLALFCNCSSLFSEGKWAFDHKYFIFSLSFFKQLLKSSTGGNRNINFYSIPLVVKIMKAHCRPLHLNIIATLHTVIILHICISMSDFHTFELVELYKDITIELCNSYQEPFFSDYQF